MLSSGFGAIRGSFAKLILKRGLKSCHFCGCRTYDDLNTALAYNRYSLIMPDLCFLLPQASANIKKENFFAWIISDKECIATDEIYEISKKRGLFPLVINLFREKDSISEKEIKSLGFSVITPKSFEELSNFLSAAQFSVSERLHGAIFSIISHTPSYIVINSEKSQALLNEIDSRSNVNKILLPYEKSSVLEKKEIGAKDSDFFYVINSLKRDINHAINEIF